MTILYFGVYSHGNPRNAVIMKGLRSQGLNVLECQARSYVELFFKYISQKKFDIMIVGFPGQKVMFLARLLTRKPIVLDIFTSHFGGYILDRGIASPRSIRARWYRFLDTWSCRLANTVLLDTNAHIEFFVREFGLRREKFFRVFVGTDTSLFCPNSQLLPTDKFLVHFHGHFIPTHGVRHIITAANILKHENIFFTLIGRGQTYGEDLKYAKELGLTNIRFIDSVPYEELPSYIRAAHVSLGLFGDTPRVHLSIPNKVFEALACRRAVITADTTAARELLTDRQSAMLCNVADPKDLTRAILELRNDPVLRHAIASLGYEVFMKHATPEKIGAHVAKICHEAIS